MLFVSVYLLKKCYSPQNELSTCNSADRDITRLCLEPKASLCSAVAFFSSRRCKALYACVFLTNAVIRNVDMKLYLRRGQILYCLASHQKKAINLQYPDAVFFCFVFFCIYNRDMYLSVTYCGLYIDKFICSVMMNSWMFCMGVIFMP